MRLLYLTFQENAPLYSGVIRKIRWQATAFRKLGYEVTFSLWEDHSLVFYTGEKKESFPLSGGKRLMKQFYRLARKYLESNRFDVLYFRLDRVAFGAVRLCRKAKVRGIGHVILEIPNYPYLSDYMRNIRDLPLRPRKAVSALKIIKSVMEDRLSGLFLRGKADAAVLIGDAGTRFFGVKAISISNGIDTDSFPKLSHRQSGDIVLIGVAGTLWWQGYDRVLEGMRRYRREAVPGQPRVRFLLVGGDEREMPEFRMQVDSRGLAEDVECVGFQTGATLLESYEKADMGISTLGCYRRGLTRCSSLKAREYCTAGIPFLYAYEDASLMGKVPFAMKLPNDPTPVDIRAVVRFIEHWRENPRLSAQEQKFARTHYDWKIIMRRVLAFAGVPFKK